MTIARKRVQFVCLGNICRSPAGETVLKKRIAERGLQESIRVDSSGTSHWHVGERADARMREAGEPRGYDLDSIGRQFREEDFERFDLIVAMDRENLSNIRHLDRDGVYGAKVRLFCDFIPGKEGSDVPDPYYGGPQGFERVFDLIEEGCENILDHLLNGKAPSP